MLLEIVSHLRKSEVQILTEVVVAYFRWSYQLRIFMEGLISRMHIMKLR